MSDNRTPRELTVRAKSERPKRWQPSNDLPTPNPEPGWTFRWIRLSMLGNVDPMNLSSKLREGWEPVKAADHPEIAFGMVENDRFKDNIVFGGLMLCKTPDEFVEDRTAHYNNQANSQMTAVDQNLMRANDPRMPLFNNRETRVSRSGKAS